MAGDGLRCPGRHDASPLLTTFRTHVDDPVRGLDDVQIVFNDDDGVAMVAQPVEHAEQLFNIVEVQTGGGFVKDVERIAGVAFGQFAGQFDSLGLAAGQGRGILAEGDIRQTDVHQRLEFAPERGDSVEKAQSIFDRERKNFVDGLAFVMDFQGFAVIAPPPAHIAGDIDIRQEMHFNLDDTVALTGLAASPFDVETESPRCVTPRPCLLGTGKQLADRSEQTGVRGGVGAWCAADGTLVDIDDLVEMMQTFDGAAGGRALTGAVQVLRSIAVEGVIDKCGFARTRDPGNRRHQSDGQGHIHVFEIVAACRANEYLARIIGWSSLCRHGNGFAP